MMYEKRFLLTYTNHEGYPMYGWFDTEEEMNGFIVELNIGINQICEKLKIAIVEEID